MRSPRSSNKKSSGIACRNSRLRAASFLVCARRFMPRANLANGRLADRFEFERLPKGAFNGLALACCRARCMEWPMSKVVLFLKDESGATAIEYGLIAAGISVVIVASVNTIGSKLNTSFQYILTQLN
jgi:pilus assembly protein Flp/PilA